MNKKTITEKVAGELGCSKAEAEKFFNAFSSSIEDALVAGEDVAFIGFGTLKVKDKAAKVGVNPATGAKINIPAKKVVAFKASSALGDKINK